MVVVAAAPTEATANSLSLHLLILLLLPLLLLLLLLLLLASTTVAGISGALVGELGGTKKWSSYCSLDTLTSTPRTTLATGCRICILVDADVVVVVSPVASESLLGSGPPWALSPPVRVAAIGGLLPEEEK